jgi:hypothetical protein
MLYKFITSLPFSFLSKGSPNFLYVRPDFPESLDSTVLWHKYNLTTENVDESFIFSLNDATFQTKNFIEQSTL